jgi:hypothetical protein
MTKMLLILVLFGSSDQESGERIAKELTALTGTSARVVMGAAAAKELDARGVKDSDLMASSAIGEQLTKRSPELVVVRIEGRTSGGDRVIESAVWSRGRVDRHVAIAGRGGDVVEGAAHGVVSIVAPMLPDSGDTADAEDARLPRLADAGEWEELLQLAAPYGPPGPHPSVRHEYYEVLALTRLHHNDFARDALARMREAHPDHVLTDAAATLIPPDAPVVTPQSSDDTKQPASP